jgi:eukaryotic-like serine/threonine-protein kinase
MARVTGLIGTTVSHYRVIGKLGVGGMGIVYDAEDSRLPRRVALKFLPDELADDPDSTRRLEREAQTIALLNHPNICTIHEIDQHEGRTFIVMERLEGLNLKAYMAKKTLETEEIVDIALQITEALEVAHSKGIIHRDIKPGNIFVGSDRQVKVLDFGLARRVTTTTDSTAPIPNGSTIPGRPLGTASYMAPERILQMRLDGRCDLFSLGVVMYEMATGRLPFTGSSPGETVTNILEKQPTPLTKLSPERPKPLEQIVGRLLIKEPDYRYQSAEALKNDLLTLANGPTSNPFRRLIGRLRRS